MFISCFVSFCVLLCLSSCSGYVHTHPVLLHSLYIVLYLPVYSPHIILNISYFMFFLTLVNFAIFSSTQFHLISQADMSDLICDLNLSKNQSELLAFRLKSFDLPQNALRYLCPVIVKKTFYHFFSGRQFSVL